MEPREIVIFEQDGKVYVAPGDEVQTARKSAELLGYTKKAENLLKAISQK